MRGGRPPVRDGSAGPACDMTLRLTDIEGSRVLGEADSELGTVRRVLFHPTEPRAVAVMVDPPAIAAGLVQREPRYALLGDLRIAPGEVRFAGRKLLRDEPMADGPDGARHPTIVWRGMGVAGPSGTECGRVADALLEPGTGAVTGIELSGGATADTAYGILALPVEAVLGYADGALRIDRESSVLEASGGLAKSAARASVDIGGAAGRAAEVAGSVAGKAARRAKGTWRDVVSGFKQGYRGD